MNLTAISCKYIVDVFVFFKKSYFMIVIVGVVQGSKEKNQVVNSTSHVHAPMQFIMNRACHYV